MTEVAVIRRQAEETLTEVFTPVAVEDILIESGVDWEGNDLLVLTVVIGEGAIDALGGERLINALIKVRKAMEEAGEDRKVRIRYATAQELIEDGDPES